MTLKALIFDLDGTVYRGAEPITGAAEFIQNLSVPYLFVTNRGNRTPAAVAQQLQNMGIPCTENHILTSAQATASYIGAGKRVYCIGEIGVTTAIGDIGSTIIDENETTPDVVVVSYDRDFNYQKLMQALRYIKAGARFIATNDDQVITIEDGLAPEAGPLVAAIANATGVSPEIVGKPYSPIMETALSRLNVATSEVVIVGDNLLTDILAGHNAGMQTALILTGVSTEEDIKLTNIQPTWVAIDYEDLKDKLCL